MRYKLQMTNTDFGVGMFAAIPDVNMCFNEMVAYLREHPYDDYMHEFVLQRFKEFRPRKLQKIIEDVMKDDGASDPVLTTIMYEACICHKRQQHLLPLFKKLTPESLFQYTPAIHIQSSLQKDRALHSQWINVFRENLFEMKPLLHWNSMNLTPLFAEETIEQNTPTTISETLSTLDMELPPPSPRRPFEETIEYALQVLEKADTILGPAMEHKASLAPIARLRHWMVKSQTKNGRLTNSLEGIQTCYGRGLIQARADVSYSMEMAERYSSYASFSSKGIEGYKQDYPMQYAAYEELDANAINPYEIRLEVPYAGQKVHWFKGHTAQIDGNCEPILIPAQFVFLFCNLDEQSLFSALGSTGLASGNTLTEAKVSSLLEVIERDCDATILFDVTRCFKVTSDDPTIANLLKTYKDDGIDVWFVDVTSEFGIPCYKSIVLGQYGDVNKGSGCDLNGKSALISALTETAYPFPGPKSAPAPKNIPTRKLEDLPNYSTGSAEGDLTVIEKTLIANNYAPAYADLTRQDLNIPVTRAIVPGLEIIADFDQYSRVSPRLYRNYLNIIK